MSFPGASGPAGTVAWMEGLLRARLGKGAVLGTITFAGPHVRVEGARLPLGPGVALHVDHVVVELGAGLPLGELPIAARLVALACEVRARGRALPLSFTARDGGEASFAHGALRVGDVEVTLQILATGWSLAGAGLDAHGAVSPLRLAGLRARQLPLALGMGLPTDLTLTGTLEPRGAGGLLADLAVATARSRLVLTGGASSSLHDVRLTGRVSLADLAGLLPAGRVPWPEATVHLDLTAAGAVADPTLHGRVFAEEVGLSRGGAALRVEQVSLTVDADRRRLRGSNLVARVRGARLAGWGSLPFAPPSGAAEPLLALQIERVDAELLAAVAAVAGVRVGLARPGAAGLPPDLRLGGEVMVGVDRAASGSFTLETPRSEVVFHLALGADRGLLGSTLRGRFAAADAAHLGLVVGPVRPRAADELILDAHLSGTLDRPGITGRLSAARLSLDTGFGAIEVLDASVVLDAQRSGLAWQKLAGRLGGGSFTSSGRLGRDTGALEGKLTWSGVRVDDLPLRTPDDRPLAEVLRGVCSGEIRVARESFVAHALVAGGRVTLAEPVYLFVRALAPTLARYGLPPVEARGDGPFMAALRFEHGELLVDPASASLDGLDVDGTLQVGAGGRLSGCVRVHLLEGYLAQSALLAIPAALAGKVVLPIYVRGTPGALEVETDALEILDGLLAGSRVGDAVKSVLDGLWSAARPSRKRR